MCILMYHLFQNWRRNRVYEAIEVIKEFINNNTVCVFLP